MYTTTRFSFRRCKCPHASRQVARRDQTTMFYIDVCMYSGRYTGRLVNQSTKLIDQSDRLTDASLPRCTRLFRSDGRQCVPPSPRIGRRALPIAPAPTVRWQLIEGRIESPWKNGPSVFESEERSCQQSCTDRRLQRLRNMHSVTQCRRILSCLRRTVASATGEVYQLTYSVRPVELISIPNSVGL